MSLSIDEFEVQIAHSIAEIDREAWDLLGQGRPFSSSGWYRYAELVLEDTLPIYIILSKTGKQVARGTFWLHRQEPLPISSRLVRWGINKLIYRRPFLICRTPLVDVPGVILPEPPLQDVALKRMTMALQDIAQKHQSSFLIFDYLTNQAIGSLNWPPDYTVLSLTSPGTYLPISWPDFDSYLKQLGAKKRRNYQKHMQFVISDRIKMKRYSKVPYLSDAIRLIRNVEHHHKSAPNPWVTRMLENMSVVNATWIAAEQENQLVAGCLVLHDGPFGVMTLLGRNYNVDHAYFAVIYEAIRCLMEKGVHTLRGGSGGYEFKRRLGFKLDDNDQVVFTGFSKTLRWLGRQF